METLVLKLPNYYKGGTIELTLDEDHPEYIKRVKQDGIESGEKFQFYLFRNEWEERRTKIEEGACVTLRFHGRFVVAPY